MKRRILARQSDRESLSRCNSALSTPNSLSFLRISSHTLTSSSTSSSRNQSASTPFSGSFNTPDKAGMFWHGALRQTANKHIIPSQDTKPVFRLTTDILPPVHGPVAPSALESTLSFAIVSSYSLDLPWLYSLFSPDVPVILIAQPGQNGRADLHHTLPGWVRTSPALPGGRGCMHVKVSCIRRYNRLWRY